MTTISETIEQLRSSLRDYIEATYHIGHPTLVELRRRLLLDSGVIHQIPYIESTPRYFLGQLIRDIGLDDPVVDLFIHLSEESDGQTKLVHDPPYAHQVAALQSVILNKRSALITTGTGSGKTECFLYPILAKLVKEATNDPLSFNSYNAVRAIVLYPMNALVNDQLGRLRSLFGDCRVVNAFCAWSGRPARFARYTGRTLYPGVRNAKRDQQYLTPIKNFYVRHAAASAAGDPKAATIVEELQKRGKWPSKEDIVAWYGPDHSKWVTRDGEFLRCICGPHDAELLTRHEVLAFPPDILITNYSMLEYMLMRPLERPIFDNTAQWLHDNPDEKLLLVVDEAHLYRGAQGTEVALLIRRLMARLGITSDRLQVICTSASIGKSRGCCFVYCTAYRQA